MHPVYDTARYGLVLDESVEPNPAKLGQDEARRQGQWN
jgi:hypothetical protein